MFTSVTGMFCAPLLVLLSGSSCTINNQQTGPSSLQTPSYPSTAAAGEADTVWWNRVPGASVYKLYYTSDGTDPTPSSPNIAVGAETSYVHQYLDPTLTYTYSVQATGGGRASVLSESSWPVQPLPMIHATITFANYTYENVGFMTFKVDGNYAPISGTFKTVAGTTDAYGDVTFDMTADHDSYWGFSTFKDLDGNGVLSTGDTVWGNVTSAGRYGTFYWKSPFTSSKTISESFETAFDSLPHMY
jgi:hypothetical protein